MLKTSLAALLSLAVPLAAQTTRPHIPVNDLPIHKEMPEPLTFQNGHKVTTPEQWRHRREEMKAILEDYEYGHMPPPPGNAKGRETQSKVLPSGRSYRQIHLTFGP